MHIPPERMEFHKYCANNQTGWSPLSMAFPLCSEGDERTHNQTSKNLGLGSVSRSRDCTHGWTYCTGHWVGPMPVCEWRWRESKRTSGVQGVTTMMQLSRSCLRVGSGTTTEVWFRNIWSAAITTEPCRPSARDILPSCCWRQTGDMNLFFSSLRLRKYARYNATGHRLHWPSFHLSLLSRLAGIFKFIMHIPRYKEYCIHLNGYTALRTVHHPPTKTYCQVAWSDYRWGFRLDIEFIDHFTTWLGTTSNYSIIANLHTLPITRAHAKSFPDCCVFSRSLVTAFNSGDSTSALWMAVPFQRTPFLTDCRTERYSTKQERTTKNKIKRIFFWKYHLVRNVENVC
jgi:ribosomal protein L33